MSSEIQQAFAHPLERAEATGGDAPLDRISVRNHVVDVEIGAFQAERDVTQRLSFNVVVEVGRVSGDVDDDVDRILSYDRITEAIAAGLAEERLNLLETLAERIAEIILIEPQAVRVFVRIEKLDRGPGALGVEIVRSRPDAAEHRNVAMPDIPRPRVVYLANEAANSPLLEHWIRSQPDDLPMILCLGWPDVARPNANGASAQEHVDFLAIEQNAWCLAAHVPQAKVVSTRTELDWAMKNGQICIWAPSKIVLDAVERPKDISADPIALALWFAKEMKAAEFVCVGAALPAEPETFSVALTTEFLPV